MGHSHSKSKSKAAAAAPGSQQLQKVTKLVQGTAGKLQTMVIAGQKGQHHVRNVFAKPLQELLGGKTIGGYHPPVFPKTAGEAAFLKEALPKNFVFEHVSDTELQQLVDAMEQVTVTSQQVVIQQGDSGDYFYVVYSGTVNFLIDGTIVGSGAAGDSFGELSLLYTTPRAATVQAVQDTVVLYRVDQTVFRYILQQQSVSAASEKTSLLKQVAFLTDLDDYSIHKLAGVMTPTPFEAGAVIMKKGDAEADLFYILSTGSVKCTEVVVGEVAYEDVLLKKSGDYFGERALVTGEPRAATVTAVTDTLCYTIDKQTFETVLGDFKSVILKASDKQKLSAIKVIADSKLNLESLSALTRLVEDRTFTAGTTICEAEKSTVAALYLVRTGSVTIQSDKGETKTVRSGGYFGEDQLKADVGAMYYKVGSAATCVPSYTVIAGTEDVTCGVLTVAACRKVLNTRCIGKPEAVSRVMYDSIVDKGVPLKSLKRHAVLGAGTFGMVFLVSRETTSGERVAYALKVQSKYELCKDGQAAAVVDEKNIMANLHHPFLIGLVNTYQDENFVYILLQLVQGGELYSYMHTPKRDFLREDDAQFYAACIADGLGFMHRNGFVYRDLKPENVLVDATGYCVIIDFGFAKHVPIGTKTFTLCGTPLYLPPEVILNRGHNGSADHWSLGILIYEMLTGDTPFYKRGMEQMDLFRAIVKCRYTVPANLSSTANAIISSFVTKDPAKRLGNLAGGEDDVAQHPWFAAVNFDELRQKTIKAPKIPNIKDPLDSSNFEDWSHLDDKTKMKFPKLSKEQLKVFENF